MKTSCIFPLFNLLRAIVCLFACALTTGCMIHGSSVGTEELFKEERLNAIKDNKSTRSEILQMFGPPHALLREGKTTELKGATSSDKVSYEFGSPSPQKTGERKSIELKGPTSTEQVSYDTSILLFSPKHEPSPNLEIYYYQEYNYSSKGVVVVAMGADKLSIERKRLWILVNVKDGIVIDHVFRND